MNNSVIIYYTTQLLWITLLLSLPVVLAAATIGLLTSFLQALTQIQDQTLQFLIKLLAVAIALLCSYHWIGATLMHYTQQIFMQLSQHHY